MDWAQFLKASQEQEYREEAIKTFKQAYEFAAQELAHKKRLSGESYFEHNARVAVILIQNRADPETVTAGLLHGLFYLREKIISLFGSEVWSLVIGGEEIKSIKSKNPHLEAEGLRKIILATLRDVRIVLIKLAAKINNLRTINPLPLEEQKRIAAEALEVYAPLASRLGADAMRVQLEDLAFRILHPQKYAEILNFLTQSQEQREKDIENAITLITKLCKGKVTILKIKGRPKHLYGMYKKMTQRGVKLHEQHDFLGVRIIVPEVKDCYIVLGLLHENLEPVEGRLKDYIANPKPNFYRSIHTGVLLPNGKLLEIQIRTPEMDELAEEGIAAHWRYKGIKSEQNFEKKVGWLREVLNLQKELEGKEFLEAAKIDVFGDEMYCYTPKGDVKELPKGAALLDFAYAVHEEVGNHAVGGRVNGLFVPLTHTLTSCDIVEVLTNKNQRPRRSWMKIVRSAKSRQKIRKSLKEHEKLAPLHYRALKTSIAEEQGVLVEAPEFSAALCTLAKCCWPLPGEAIVGFPTKRRIISIHSPECRAALKEEERWISVQWRQSFSQKIRFYVQAEERSGLLADLLHTIANSGFEVKEAKAKILDTRNAECSFLVIPRDLETVKEMIRRVRKVKGVKKIYFE